MGMVDDLIISLLPWKGVWRSLQIEGPVGERRYMSA
jgi:hypothetical protein